MESDRYVSFIYNYQFKRKISPMMYFLSDKGIKAMLAAVLVYNFTEGKVMTISCGIVFIYTIKSYLDTRINYASKLAKNSAQDKDTSLPPVAWYLAHKERYLRQSQTERSALIQMKDFNLQELKEQRKQK